MGFPVGLRYYEQAYKSYRKDAVSDAHWAMEYRTEHEGERERKTRQLHLFFLAHRRFRPRHADCLH
jgi:hypothetical protein